MNNFTRIVLMLEHPRTKCAEIWTTPGGASSRVVGWSCFGGWCYVRCPRTASS